MSRTALIALASLVTVIVLGLWVLSWFRAPDAVSKSAAQPWPGQLGTLDSVASRFPPRQGNAASVKLIALARALPKSETAGRYLAHEMGRGDLAIGNPPTLPDVSALRELLLRDEVIWERRQRGVGDTELVELRVLQTAAARALVANALAKGHPGDATAWDDLHAAWRLAQSLEAQPEMMEQTASFSIARMINALSWKMPLPAPGWLAEVQQRDDVAPLLQAFQYQAASYWKSGASAFPTKWLANSVEHDRRIAESLSRETRCDVTVPANELGVDLSSVWHRAFRARAEREAAANALRVRDGKAIETGSRCSDGTWAFDGATLRFSRNIAPARSDAAMPLALQLRVAAR